MTAISTTQTSTQLVSSTGLQWATKLLIVFAMINILCFESNVSTERLLLLEVEMETETDELAPSTNTATGIRSRRLDHTVKTPHQVLQSGRAVDAAPFPTLPQLTRADEQVTCPEGLVPVDMIVNETVPRAVQVFAGLR